MHLIPVASCKFHLTIRMLRREVDASHSPKLTPLLSHEWGLFSSTQVRFVLLHALFMRIHHRETIGGPGGSGLENINALSAYLLTQTGGHYDIVSWDPRVGGLSTYALISIRHSPCG